MTQKLFAFWRYDSFPFVLGGTVTKLHSNGSVETIEYGPGYSFMPIKILPLKEGKALMEEIRNLQDQERKASEEFRKIWQKKLNDLVSFVKKD